jgi:hypothetical protein
VATIPVIYLAASTAITMESVPQRPKAWPCIQFAGGCEKAIELYKVRKFRASCCTLRSWRGQLWIEKLHLQGRDLFRKPAVTAPMQS